jgi:hypothetical protein
MDTDVEYIASHPAGKQAAQGTQVTSEEQAQSTQVDRGRELRAIESWKRRVTKD